MRIAQVVHSYYPYFGGIETVVKEISERLVQKGVNVEVLCEDPLRKYPSVEVINGVRVRRFKNGLLGWDFAFSKNTLRKFLKENSGKYDLVHAHGYGAFPVLYAAWAKQRNKLVFSAYFPERGRTWFTSLLHIPCRLIGKVIFERADRIICVSETEKAAIRRHFSVSGKFTLTPLGVNIEEITKAKPFPFDGKLLLYVGRLEKYKNIHLAINAMPYLPAEYKLVVIGNGPYKGKLLQLISKLKLTDRVQILSGLPNEEVYRWYKTCNLVLNLSSSEAFGLTVLEGLAAGKPVVVNKKTALAEVATKFDQVYPVNATTLSPSHLAEAIIQGCGIIPLMLDLKEYSWESITKKVLLIYQELMT